MAVKDFTYDHTKVKISLNGLPITELVDSVTVTTDGEDWTVTEGLNDTVQFSKRSNNLATVTLPMQPGSDEYKAIKGFRILDRETGAGPFPFAFMDLNNGDTVLGTARIMSMGDLTNGQDATARNVVLKVIKQAEA